MYEQIEKHLLDAMKSLDHAMHLMMRLPGNKEENERNTGILEKQKQNIQEVLQRDYDENARNRKNQN